MIKELWRKSLLHQYHANYINIVSVDGGKWFDYCNLCDEPLKGVVRKTFREDEQGRIVNA